jgi:Divergent InlB B-repeat domain
VLRLLLATALAASAPLVANDPGYDEAWSLTQGDPGVVIAVVGNGVAADQAGVCKLCRVLPVRDVRSAIDQGADVILLADCVPPADVAGAFAHGLPVVGCNTLDVGDPPAVAGLVGLMLSCNPSLTPDEVRLILLETSGSPYDAVVRAGCRKNPAEIVRLMIAVRGHGTVARLPDDDTYNAGTVVALRAKPNAHWRFAHWSGVCDGRRPLCTVRLLQSGVTTAAFRRR